MYSRGVVVGFGKGRTFGGRHSGGTARSVTEDIENIVRPAGQYIRAIGNRAEYHAVELAVLRP